MNTRKYNTNPKILLEQGKAIMSSTDEARFHFKVFVVNMVLSGCPRLPDKRHGGREQSRCHGLGKNSR